MPTEAGRHKLYEKIATEWGAEHAEELMSHLPPVGWADVATKRDLEAQTLLLRADFDRLGAGIRTEIADERAAVSDKIAGLQRTMINLMVLLTAIFGAISTIAAIAA
jgi:hypothetical protein